MLRILPVIALLTLCRAQQPQTFRSSTTLIEFTIVAVDTKGVPVTDLKKEEIVLTENGAPRPIAFLRFEGEAGATATRPVPPGAFTNRPEYLPGPPRNVTAIVLDAVNVSPADQIVFRSQLLRYLQELPPNTRAALYRIGNGITVLHDFTSDAEALRDRIAKNDVTMPWRFATPGIRTSAAAESRAASPEAKDSVSQARSDEARVLSIYNEDVRDKRLAMTLAGLEAVGNHLAAIPGRKSIVWVSSGMPVFIDSAGFLKTYAAAIRKTAERLASQGIAVYPVVQLTARSRVLASLDILAEVSGGRVVKVMNDQAKGITVAADDVRATHSVGFYAVQEPDNRWRHVEVKVKRPGVRLLYRQGYMATAPSTQPLQWSEQQWRAAIANPLGSSAVRLDARLEPRAGAHFLLLHIACDDLHFIKTGDRAGAAVEIAIAEVTATGESAFHLNTATLTLAETASHTAADMMVRYTRDLKLRAGTTTLRLIVRDQSTGRHGTLDIPVEPPPTEH